MTYVACIVAAAPIRALGSHRSEMVSQLLLGEFAKVLEVEKDFVKVQCLHDGYEGWCQTSQLTEVDEDVIRYTNVAYTTERNAMVRMDNTAVYPSLSTPVYDDGKELQLGKYELNYSNVAGKEIYDSFDGKIIARLANNYLNTPYLWGGRSSFGIDCSGFTQQVFKVVSINLMRDAYQQATQGEVVGFLQESICGDLAFFDNEEGRITHVGIMLNAEEIIHSSGRVRIDKMDNQGIINTDTGQRTHKLRIIKRIR
ncbi:MAG: C40 family peptidase [Filimonas sp.]|nr:C40 family peptidase [Filimonas sp.]